MLLQNLFLFHHRQLLKDYASEHPESKKYIDALFEYVENRFGMEFAEADGLFARGMVNQACILNLFLPNELVISGTHGRPAAFCLQEWPELTRDGWVTLSCWSFQSDGSSFTRKKSVLSIPPIDTKTMDIQNLVVYPFKFATQEIQQSIGDYGRKHWELRIATQITYKGWNVGKDQFFVSSRLSCLFVLSAEAASPTLDS